MGLYTKRFLLAFGVSLGISFSAHANHGHVGHAHVDHGHIGHAHIAYTPVLRPWAYYYPYINPYYSVNYSPLVYPWVGWGFYAGIYAPYYNYPLYTGPYWNNYYYQPETHSFAVLSYSLENKKASFGFGSSINGAKARSLKACGSKDCQAMVWVYRNCAAIAQSESTGEIGRAIDPDARIASNKAVNDCKQQGFDDCKPHAWVCAQ